ncbi:MAG: hypothetical protein WD739_07490 [Actinomycetota bacterium]
MSDPMIEIPEEMHLLATKTAAVFDEARVAYDQLRQLQDATAAERDRAREIIAGTMTAIEMPLSLDPQLLPPAAADLYRQLQELGAPTPPNVLLGHNQPEPWARSERVYRMDESSITRIKAARAAGRRVLWSWHPALIGSDYGRLAHGEHDDQLQRIGIQLNGITNGRVDVAFAHEGERKCEGHPAQIPKWGTADEYVAAAERFRSIVVDPFPRMRYVLCLLRESYEPAQSGQPQTGWADRLEHAGIQIFAADPYSWWGFKGLRYPAIRELIDPCFQFAKARGKRAAIWEIDGPPDPDEPEREADWLRAGLLSALDLNLVTFCGFTGTGEVKREFVSTEIVRRLLTAAAQWEGFAKPDAPTTTRREIHAQLRAALVTEGGK